MTSQGTGQGSLSAFGIDHGISKSQTGVSKRERSTKEGAKLGAKVGAGVGAGGVLLATPRAARHIGVMRQGLGRAHGRLAAANYAVGAGEHVAVKTGAGAGLGALIGRKKKGK